MSRFIRPILIWCYHVTGLPHPLDSVSMKLGEFRSKGCCRKKRRKTLQGIARLIPTIKFLVCCYCVAMAMAVAFSRRSETLHFIFCQILARCEIGGFSTKWNDNCSFFGVRMHDFQGCFGHDFRSIM